MRWIVFIILSMSISGCSTVELWSTPQFEGVVRSTEGRPLDHVEILLEKKYQDTPIHLAFTDAEGRFQLPAERKMVKLFLGDPGARGAFIFQKPGYEPIRSSFSFSAPTKSPAPTHYQTTDNTITMTKQKEN